MRGDILYTQVIDGEEFEKAQAAADAADNLPPDEIEPDTFFCTQLYDRYTDDDHRVWQELWDARMAVLDQQASPIFINGLDAIGLERERVPDISRVNARLMDLTGWQSRPVPGYLPAKAFFACLARREFPTTVTMRPRSSMNYLPEPDIVHDVFGHVPLHADPVFAEFLQTYGQAALVAGEEHTARLARLFWFTVEFGLIEHEGDVRLYGSGLISSHGESEHAMSSPHVDRRPFDLELICETHFEIDHYQGILYVLESFEQLRDAMNEYSSQVLRDSGVH